MVSSWRRANALNVKTIFVIIYWRQPLVRSFNHTHQHTTRWHLCDTNFTNRILINTYHRYPSHSSLISIENSIPLFPSFVCQTWASRRQTWRRACARSSSFMHSLSIAPDVKAWQFGGGGVVSKLLDAMCVCLAGGLTVSFLSYPLTKSGWREESKMARKQDDKILLLTFRHASIILWLHLKEVRTRITGVILI